MFEVLEAAEKGQAEVLVRAVHERKCLTTDNKIEGGVWDLVADEHIAGCMSVQVPRRGKRPARKAELEIRFRKVRVRSPNKKGKTRGAQSWAITAVETDMQVRDRINWLLLTSMPIECAEDAAEKVRWYMKRWQIEVYFKTLKSGCRIEDRQSASADSLKVALAIDAVVAWRIMYLSSKAVRLPTYRALSSLKKMGGRHLIVTSRNRRRQPRNLQLYAMQQEWSPVSAGFSEGNAMANLAPRVSGEGLKNLR